MLSKTLKENRHSPDATCWFSRGYDMRHDQEMEYVAILIDGHQSILRSLLHSTESKMMVG